MIISTDFWYLIQLVKDIEESKCFNLQASLKNVVFLHLCYCVMPSTGFAQARIGMF